jgi:hypothetical protein
LFTFRLPSRRAAGKFEWRDFFQVHPAADVFPLLPPDELRKLAADIERNGLKVPIQTRQVAGDPATYVIDGRNRLDAMEKVLGWAIIDGNGNWAGVLANVPNTEPGVKHFVGRTHQEIISEIRAFNIKRRHLTKQQIVEMIDATLRATKPAAREFLATDGEKLPKRREGRPKDEHKAAVVTEAARAGISQRTVERSLGKGRAAKPRRPKPPVDKTSLEYVNKRFGMFLKHWQRHQWQAVRRQLRHIL